MQVAMPHSMHSSSLLLVMLQQSGGSSRQLTAALKLCS